MGAIGARRRTTEAWRARWVRRSARVGKKPRPLPWGGLGIVLLLLVALPTACDVLLARVYPGLVAWLQYAVTGVYALTSLMLVWEASAAWRLKAEKTDETPPLPACTAVIAAYLPNEQGIILETLRHMLAAVDVPPDRFQVILAYNTPESLAIEADLQEIAARDPRLLPLRVSGSRSKAENVNAALGAATGEIVAVYDADHRPAPDCFRRAWRRISAGADMVQGRCVIRNHAQNWLARTGRRRVRHDLCGRAPRTGVPQRGGDLRRLQRLLAARDIDAAGDGPGHADRGH